MARGPKLQSNLPGFGFIYQPSYTYKGETKHSAVWWMQYRALDGSEVRVSTKQRDQRKAYECLQLEHDRYRKGEIGSSDAETVTIGELLDLMLDGYRGNVSYTKQRQTVEKHIRPEWGDKLAIRLTRTAVDRWTRRLEATLSDASINRLLSALRQSLKAGAKHDPPLVRHIPEMPWRAEDNARQGTISRELYTQIRDLLPRHAQLAWVIGYHTGLRKGVILSLQWNWINWEKGVIAIPEPTTRTAPGRPKGKRETKIRPRHVPVWGEMRGYLEMARATAQTDYVIEWRDEDCEWRFRAKDPTAARLTGAHACKSIRSAWEAARVLAGAPRALFHDLRRTAATLMHDVLKLDPTEIMRIVGWRSEAMLRRYHIGSEEHAANLGRTMDQRWAEAMEGKPATVRQRAN